MTLDEAIARENKIAEENQKIVDTQIVFDDVSISELYCDDTEVIEEHLSNYRKCAEYHEQLAEWLEELKAYQQQHISLCEKHDVNTVEDLYVKAIDDLVKEFKRKTPMENCLIDELAEQLKAGVAND